MLWEKLQIVREAEQNDDDQNIVRRVVKRWSHTLNVIMGGLVLYVFGGIDETVRQMTNQVLVFDTAARKWRQPVIIGVPPEPRCNHTANVIGDNIYVLGGVNLVMQLFNDLHVFNTSTNTWTSPRVSGEVPSARKGHAAEVIGKQLFVHGGCGHLSQWLSTVCYDDLYILDTDTFVWRKAVTSGAIPCHRESHTCSSWGNKLVVIGGKDWDRNYLSDVHILDTDTLVWTNLNTCGQIMPPRAAHTTVAVGKNLFVFGGYLLADILYDDLYKIDLDTGAWTKLAGVGEGPSPRHALAGDFLYSQNAAVLVFFGGCDHELNPTEDVYYFHTGLQMEDRGKQTLENECPRNKKAKCQEQGQGSTNLREYLPFPGFRPFQATIKEILPDRYIIETTIDGKLLHGVLLRSMDEPNRTFGESSQIKENVEPEHQTIEHQTTEHQNANH